MLVRGALARLASDVPKTRTHNLPHLARNASNLPAVRALSRAYSSVLGSRRSYATTTRATKPTETVKKAVKADAAKKPAPKKTAVAAKKPVAKPKAKAATKKPAPKKAPAKKTAAKTPAAKRRTPKKRVKKALTPEQQEKATIAELRKKALKEPVTPNVVTGFNAYIIDVFSGSKGASSTTDNKVKLAETANNWKNLTAAEHEHYNHMANKLTEAKQAQYQAWIHSHTPDQIRIANNARAILRRKLVGTLKTQKYPKYTTKLKDDRQLKRATPAFFHFLKDRYASGDLKGIVIRDMSKLVANEWKALGASEKKKYEDMAQAEKAERAVAHEKMLASS